MRPPTRATGAARPGSAVLQSFQPFPATMRRLLNDYPGLTTAISIGLLLLALVIMGFYLWPRAAGPANPPATDESQDDVHAAAACTASDEPVRVAAH